MPAWSAPATWTPVIVTVPQMNAEIRDKFNALHPAVISSALNVTVAASDGHSVIVLVDASGGNRTVNFYTAVANGGAVIQVKKTDSSANTVTVDPNLAETADAQATRVLSAQYETVTFASDNANWQIRGSHRPPSRRVVAAGPVTATVADDTIVVSGGTFTVNLHPAAQDRQARPLTVKVLAGSGALITVDGDAGELIDDDLTLLLYPGWSLSVVPNTGGTGWLIV